MLSRSIKWMLIITVVFVLAVMSLYLSIYFYEKGMYAYEVIHASTLRWVFPVHEFDTETGREWNTLKQYHLSASKKDELIAYAVSNQWNTLPFTEAQLLDELLNNYPDETIEQMKNAQNGYWMDVYNQNRRRYLCLIDIDSSMLYIRSSSVL